MRALLPLLAALSAAAAPPSAPAPLALVLRAACPAPLRTAFHEPAVLSYEPMRKLFDRYHVRLLTYEDTCGPEWRARVTLRALSTVSEGGTVASAGCAGADVCAALVAAARALQRALPAACAVGEARGAVVARLAARLRWARALLAPAAPRSECGAALRAAAGALAAAGVAVSSAPLSPQELARQPDVVILCASRGGRERGVAGERRGAAGEGPPALLLLVDECDRAPNDDVRTLQNDTYDAFQLSNITLDIGQSLTARNKKRSIIDQLPGSAGDVGAKLSRLADGYKMQRLKNSTKMDSVRLRSDIDDGRKTYFQNKYKGKAAKSENFKTDSVVGDQHHSESARATDVLSIDIEYLLPPIEITFFRRVLLLTDVHSAAQPVTEDKVVYDNIIEAIKNQEEAEHAQAEFVDIDFYLYERSSNASASWRLAAVLTASSAALDASRRGAVRLANESARLHSWSAVGAGRRPLPAAPWAAAGAALALAAGSALLLRWVAARRRRRRRRRDAVLSPADFTFPVDERRRVGEGMETMLSCWLQQLHEFGGPELERPDLLKQPTIPAPAAPRAPSAPSSTCSVNRVALDRRVRYKGDVVHVRQLPGPAGLELRRKATDVLLLMQNLRHENLNPFIGCLCSPRPALVFDACGRGSLEDVLMADDIKLDWTFRLSLLTDLVRGMRYLHASPLRVHGRLSSRNCVVDSRWVLRVTDFGLPALFRAQALPQPLRAARDLLWTAPELLREQGGGGRGTQPGDVFSFAIIMQEVIVRGEPYCMLALTPEEIVEKVSRPPPLIRPSVSMGAAPPDAVSVMRQCWSEAPDLRPDFHRLHDIFRHLHRGRKINIVDSMFEMLEKYSNNLEELIKERTEQLDMEKKKTEQLLNRMLPRSVAERLMLGSRVEPEEFADVSIYFSDIVGFTALAARCTPVQVVDLLNDLYTTFDAAIEQYRVYKVETIGDAYMVVGGLPVRTRDHAESVATMALHLLHLAGRFRLRHLPDTPLHLRIGLHSGPCCAAVVGLTMPRYCLFGDTVNTASRMESTGAAWRIQVSAATAERLMTAGGYRLRSRGLTMIKGKGAMHTYWLLGKEGFDKPLPTPPPLQSEEVLFEVDGESECESSPAPSCSPPLAQPEAPATTAPSAPPVERQRSDPTSAADKQAWQRSGAVSADSSPPRPGRRSTDSGDSRTVPPAGDHSAQYSRYRCLGAGRRPLRRQWSLERGDTLAAAAAVPGAQSAPPSPPEPLALAGWAPPRAARYRTRPEPVGPL